MAKNFEINCPCCEAMIVVDRITGEVLLHKAKERKAGSASLETMVSGLASEKQAAAKRFERELESQKDRARLLEEKFKEALQRAEADDTPRVNPFDMD